MSDTDNSDSLAEFEGEGLNALERSQDETKGWRDPLIPLQEHRLRHRDGSHHMPDIELRPEEEANLNDPTNWQGGLARTDNSKGHVEFTDELKLRFVELLCRYGIKYKCAKAVGISTMTFNNHLNSDPDFAEAVATAMDVFRGLIEETIQDRAIHGWDEPVYSQKLGIQIGTIRRFDNRLLELLAKRHIPDYREKQQLDVNHTGGVLVVPGSTPSEQEWIEQNKPKQVESKVTTPQLEDKT